MTTFMHSMTLGSSSAVSGPNRAELAASLGQSSVFTFISSPYVPMNPRDIAESSRAILEKHKMDIGIEIERKDSDGENGIILEVQQMLSEEDMELTNEFELESASLFEAPKVLGFNTNVDPQNMPTAVADDDYGSVLTDVGDYDDEDPFIEAEQRSFQEMKIAEVEDTNIVKGWGSGIFLSPLIENKITSNVGLERVSAKVFPLEMCETEKQYNEDALITKEGQLQHKVPIKTNCQVLKWVRKNNRKEQSRLNTSEKIRRSSLGSWHHCSFILYDLDQVESKLDLPKYICSDDSNEAKVQKES